MWGEGGREGSFITQILSCFRRDSVSEGGGREGRREGSFITQILSCFRRDSVSEGGGREGGREGRVLYHTDTVLLQEGQCE